jgi:Ca2+-binding RTX toxin-like protein
MLRNWWMKLVNRCQASRRSRVRRDRRWLGCGWVAAEQLEARSLLTVLFTPQYPGETLKPVGGNTLNSPPVYLIFWGQSWTTGAGVAEENQIINAAKTLFSSGYFSETQQYQTGGKVVYGGADTFPIDPPPNFSGKTIGDLVKLEIDNGKLPEADDTNNHGMYVVFTPPGVQSDQPNDLGYNSFTWEFDGANLNDLDGFTDDDVFAWVGSGDNTKKFNIDNYTKILSHEVVEAITSPQSFRPFPNIAFNGYPVTPPPNYPNPESPGNQIGDYEAKSHQYRVDGVWVQSYWSDKDQAFAIGDGNQQTFVDDLGNLQINGDQLGSPNDFISIGENAGGGVFVDLNGETVSFDKGVISQVTVNSGSGNDNVFVFKNDVPVTINLGNGQDNVNVVPLGGLSDIQGLVSVSGGIGSSTLTIDDSSNTAPADWTVTASSVSRSGTAGVTFDGMQNIVINGGPGLAHFDVQDTEPAGFTTINTGDCSFDLVTVQATSGNLIVNDGAGHNDVTVVSQTPQDLDTIKALVTVNGQGTTDELFVSDLNNPNKSSWEITGTYVTRSYGAIGSHGGGSVVTVDFSRIHQLNVYGGSGGAAFDVSPIFHNLDEPPILAVYGHAGNVSNSLTAEDEFNSFNSEWSVSDTKVIRKISGATRPNLTATINYLLIQNLVLDAGSGTNTYRVTATNATTVTQLNMGTGNDVVRVGSMGSNVLDRVLGPLNLVGQGGADILHLADQGSSPAHTYSFTAGSATRDGIAPINYVGVAGVVVRGGSGGNQFNVAGISYAAPLTIYGGAGNDALNLNNPDLSDNPNLIHQVTFHGQGGTNTLSVNDQASPTGAAWTLGFDSLTTSTAPLLTVDFDSNVQSLNIFAGSGDDSFLILKGSPKTAIGIDAGAGVNTLIYAAYMGDVTVDLPLGLATGLANGVHNIQNIYGSIGNDLLVGDSGANILSGGTRRNIIIGGAGADKLSGGMGDNILIGGSTDYDQNIVALNDFMTEWLRTDLTFDQRVIDLVTGGQGVPTYLPSSILLGTGFRLDSQTVHDDKIADILNGGPANGHDWFLYNPFDDVLNNTRPGDRFTAVTQ